MSSAHLPHRSSPADQPSRRDAATVATTKPAIGLGTGPPRSSDLQPPRRYGSADMHLTTTRISPSCSDDAVGAGVSRISKCSFFGSPVGECSWWCNARSAWVSGARLREHDRAETLHIWRQAAIMCVCVCVWIFP